MNASQQLLPQFLRDILISVLNEQGFDVESRWEVQAGVQESPEIFSSSVYRVVIYPDETDSTKCLSLLFKCLPESFTRGKAFNSSRYFKREIDFYTKILPALLNFQSGRISRVTIPFAGVPTCYKTVCKDGNYVIVLEDMKSKGYVMLDRLQGMGIEDIRVMFKELGRFHALSLAMQDQDPAGFNTAKQTIQEDLLMDGDEVVFVRFFKAACDEALKLAKENYPCDSLYVTKTQQFVDEFHERMTMLTTADPDEPNNVISHGDIWVNNFLFHLDDTDGQRRVDAMCFLDFQACRFASLALDLSCALLLSMDRQTRELHRDILLHDYHDALRTLLTQLGLDPDAIIPFSALDGLVTRYAQFAVGLAFLNLPVQLNERADHGLVDEPEAEVETVISVLVGKTDRCKQRVLEVIEEAVDRGYFDQLVLACEGESETTRL